MTLQPITLSEAEALSTRWMTAVEAELARLPSHVAQVVADDYRKKNKSDAPADLATPPVSETFADAPDISAADVPVKPSKHGSASDPSFTRLVKAVRSERFVLVACVLTQNTPSGPLHNPLLYLVERHQRTRPTGWGMVQPYGKRIDHGKEKRIPDPDPVNVVQNLARRVVQMWDDGQKSSPAGFVPPAPSAPPAQPAAGSSAPPAPSPSAHPDLPTPKPASTHPSMAGLNLPQGVFFLDPADRPGSMPTHFLMHVVALPVSPGTALEIAKLLAVPANAQPTVPA